MTDEGMELILTVMEAKELIGPPNADTFDTFVRIYMVPDESGAVQTKVYTPFITPIHCVRKSDIHCAAISQFYCSCSETPRAPVSTKHFRFG